MDATRAYELGLLNEIVPPEQLDTCVESWIADMLECAPLSLRAIKEAAAKSESVSLDEAFTTDYPWETQRMHSVDAKEGPRAFAEKRPPRWQGR
jgi:crotonobetainyl-CoA hydratase/dehydration protein DpgD